MEKCYPFLVRRGRMIKLDEQGREWQTEVVATRAADGVVRYLVVLASDKRSEVIEHFDVHCGRYASHREETSVALSAAGHACALASDIDNEEEWRTIRRVSAS